MSAWRLNLVMEADEFSNEREKKSDDHDTLNL